MAYRRGVFWNWRKRPRKMTDKDIAWVKRLIECEARCGYRAEGEIVDEFRHRMEHGHGFAAEDAARWTAELERQLAEQRAVEATWSEVTDNDRLDRAFEQLIAEGVIAEQDAGYTMSDGWNIVFDLHEDHPGAWGATFFHRQAVEDAIAGESLLLAFASMGEEPDDAEDSSAVARKVCEVLQQHGFQVTWSGDVERKIEIAPFPWRKRRTTQPPR